MGTFASGFPNVVGPNITFLGQLLGALVMVAIGFFPGNAVAYVLKKMNALRIPEEVEKIGIDVAKFPGSPYPEEHRGQGYSVRKNL
ncbi:ammonium transporter [Halalkalibacter alkaliphilus]|uniref:Ammonium transporter n=1 Tax=Halalkalibacter alkaliphilus TaxID=2917993 RepID=A0A9X2I5A8_9BACI|nr:ammonium transporter [Halalkalibacter alkaliphilus]MCL7748521.1 ammonium transporter [Halalkalibacter alkaliphilus]